ncbi:conserved hypothetical protein [Coccidioides posadasii str. Silveira]|uniref:Uncharacterized protein n=1 Tax=Coccidioides posadasii (strain RMSCC 757 / Silveira) TaxID=443226 RepID=E9DDQ7_COCPS|nr:conserved hypothetical protein [Coccidioides posadasii str. Silveira]
MGQALECGAPWSNSTKPFNSHYTLLHISSVSIEWHLLATLSILCDSLCVCHAFNDGSCVNNGGFQWLYAIKRNGLTHWIGTISVSSTPYCFASSVLALTVR